MPFPAITFCNLNTIRSSQAALGGSHLVSTIANIGAAQDVARTGNVKTNSRKKRIANTQDQWGKSSLNTNQVSEDEWLREIIDKLIRKQTSVNKELQSSTGQGIFSDSTSWWSKHYIDENNSSRGIDLALGVTSSHVKDIECCPMETKQPDKLKSVSKRSHARGHSWDFEMIAAESENELHRQRRSSGPGNLWN